MESAYQEKLLKIVNKNKSHIVVGLDSDIEKLPSMFLKYKNPVLEFNKLIIESTKDTIAGYKLNMAFYESLEEIGLAAIKGSLSIIPDELIKICDAKRGDIGNTSELYARAYFDIYNFDSITINPYLGKDSVEPFLNQKGKCVYILALTSNSGSEDFQKLKTDGKYLYEEVIEKSLKWSKQNVGFVFGANHTDEIRKFTKLHPEIPLLIPGIGAQKNDTENLMKSLNTECFLINSSRGIIYSAPKDCSEKEFINAVRESTNNLNTEILSLMK